jgi:uncharacterized membrane protein
MAKNKANKVDKSADNTMVQKVLPWILIIGGIIGLVCSFIIVQDKMHILANPNYRPSCDINPVVACGDVMQSKQAAAFGFSNPILGLAAFPALITIGVAMLAGAKFKRWFWIGVEAGSVFGVGFTHWLFYESVYTIHSLCPYCMAVWVVTATAFLYTTIFCLQTRFIVLPKHHDRITAFLRRHHLDILLLWALIIFILIMHHFWYYYGKHFF